MAFAIHTFDFLYKLLYNSSVKKLIVNSADVRKNLSSLVKNIDDTGSIVVITIHGKPKAGMVDIDLLEQFVENAEFGISESELVERSNEKSILWDEFKKKFDV